jgi:SWI/SNF-related matrix-associated actin-dependent regulator of chromatin subfamily A member 5
LVLGFEEIPTAYFIRCKDCKQRFEEDPEALASWQEEEHETQRMLDALRLKEA